MSNYITIKLRRGTAAQWTATNPVLAEGEVGLETDTRKFKVGTGASAWNSMQYWGGSGGGAADFIDLGDVPASYSGQGGKYVKVKATADGLEFGTLTVAIGDVTGLSAALANLVPYAGASGNVNLGEFGIKAGQIDLDTSPTGTATVGTTRWNDTIGSIETTLKGGNVILKNGVDLVARIVNKVTPNTTLTKAAYQAVKVSGAQGQRLGIALAQANDDNNSADTLGLVIETIAANQEGFIMTVGTLEGINTTGSLQSETWADGDILYLSPTTAGRITNIKPTAPNHIIIIGYVEYSHANNGKIYVKIMNGWELGELHDVDTTESKTTPIDADALLLQDSADSSIWKRLTWANLKATLLTYFNSEYVAKNAAITGATKTKITYDAKGLVTAGADATTADIADSTNRRYVTDAQQTVIGNTSGTNTGDQNLFSTIAVSGQSNVVADGTGDTLTLVAGSNITITTDATTDSITIAAAGGGVSDGDKGDITVSSSGTVWTVDTDAITYAKIQNVSAASRLLGRGSAGGSGDVEEITIGTGLSMSGTTLSATGGGDVTVLDIDNSTNGPVNTTTETALYSYTLPTDFAAGEVLQLTVAGTYQNTTSSRIFTNRVKIGGTTVLSHTPTVPASASVRVWSLTLLIYIENPANLQRCSIVGLVSGAVANGITTSLGVANTPWNGSGVGDATIDLTTARTLELTVEIASASTGAYCYADSAQLIRYAAP